MVVRTFRSEAGLARSSRVTARFVRMLHRAQNGGPGDLRWLGIRRLAVGTRGRDVRLLQKDLTRLGYTAATDGQFGPQTRLSVRSFERAAGLKIDGVMSLREARTLKKVVRSGREAGAASQKPSTATAPVTQMPARRPSRAPAQPTGQAATRRRRWPRSAATVSRSLLRARPPPSWRSSRPETRSRTSRTATGVGTTRGRTPGTTARDPSASRCTARTARHPDVLVRLPGMGRGGPGQWVTVYARQDHAYMVVAGLRFDTSASKGGGSRWTTEPRSPDGYVARHPAGL